MPLYGYARVSSSDQDFALQEQALRVAGCEIIRSEKASGTSRVGRCELETLLAFLSSDMHLAPPAAAMSLPHQPFDAEAHAYHFAGAIAAKLAIADELARPLAKLAPEDRIFIDQVLAATRNPQPQPARLQTTGCLASAPAIRPRQAIS